MNRPLISIDPSIRCTGVALFDTSCELVNGALIKPRTDYTRNKIKHTIPSIDRIDEIIRELDKWLSQHPDAQFAIEVTSGKTSGRHGGKGAGLGTYGMVVGQVARWAICNVGQDRVHQIYENDWTKGKKKIYRKPQAELSYPIYKEHWSAKDGGSDLADAILLGDYTMNLINTGQIGGAA